MHHTNSSRFHDHLKNLEHFASKPLSGYRFAIIKETIGAPRLGVFLKWVKLITALCLVATGLGVQHDVVQRVLEAAAKIERLGVGLSFHRLSVPPKTHCVKAAVDFVSCPTFHLGLPAYYILALSEASRYLKKQFCLFPRRIYFMLILTVI